MAHLYTSEHILCKQSETKANKRIGQYQLFVVLKKKQFTLMSIIIILDKIVLFFRIL